MDESGFIHLTLLPPSTYMTAIELLSFMSEWASWRLSTTMAFWVPSDPGKVIVYRFQRCTGLNCCSHVNGSALTLQQCFIVFSKPDKLETAMLATAPELQLQPLLSVYIPCENFPRKMSLYKDLDKFWSYYPTNSSWGISPYKSSFWCIHTNCLISLNM